MVAVVGQEPENDAHPDTQTENTLESDATAPGAPPPTLRDDHEGTPEVSNVTEEEGGKSTPSVMPAINDPQATSPSLPAPGATAPVPTKPAPARTNDSTPVLPPIPHPHSFHTPTGRKANGHPPLTLNQLAIVTASQNKLPTSRVKGIVMRMGRHTQSSASKQGRWYKGDHYVDNANYSWRNMELFVDYQQQMYTAAGTIKTSCKK